MWLSDLTDYASRVSFVHGQDPHMPMFGCFEKLVFLFTFLFFCSVAFAVYNVSRRLHF